MTTEAPAASKTALYEAMFLISQQEASDLAGIIEHLETIFGRAGAELIAMRKWDDRRLAFEIDKQKRGIYILCYLSIDPARVQSIDRDVNLSERIMRMLILRADYLTLEQAQAADGRRELMAEAKIRAERATEGEQGRSTVSLGAPPEAEAPQAGEVEDTQAEQDAQGDQGEDGSEASLEK